MLVDSVLAGQELLAALDPVEYGTLDDDPRFRVATAAAEYFAAHIHGLLRGALREGWFGPGGGAVSVLKVTLRESPNAWAAFEGPVQDPPPPFGDPGA